MSQAEPLIIKNIAIIGAGPSGLATAKYLLAEEAFSRIVIYEQRHSVGGVWNFTPLSSSRRSEISNGDGDQASASDAVTANLPELNTPMYEGLEANLPHMVMQYSDAPFPKGTQLFPTRETVQRYLEDYASEIRRLIRFGHEVTEVKAIGDRGHEWEVTARATEEGRDIVERFDAVVAANGHCDVPLLPDIKGLDTWARLSPSTIHHSVSYKNAKAFEGKRVLLVGGGPSGADLGRQVSAVCERPLLVAQTEKSPYHEDSPDTRDYPTLIELIPEERAAKFADGNVEQHIDHVILCTGYAYSFPFLTPLNPAIKDEGVRALPLYQHIFHMHHPTLAFVETPEKIVPFPLAECQAAVIARVWSGRLALPTLQEMQKWQESVLRERGVGRKFHALTPPLDLEYMKEMYDWSCNASNEGTHGNIAKGKIPKRWDEKACWLRMTTPEMKKAFNARGQERSNVMSYEELGFRFDDTKRE